MRGSRAIWLMMPAAAVDSTLDEIVPLVARDDVIIHEGNSYYHDDMRRAKALAANGIHYVDVGSSGGVWGFERGFGRNRQLRRAGKALKECLRKAEGHQDCVEGGQERERDAVWSNRSRPTARAGRGGAMAPPCL